MCQVRDRVVVVTGAGGALGRAVVGLFVEHGAKVGVLDRDEGRLAETFATEIAGGRVLGVGVDLTDEAAVAAAVARVEGALGPAHALVTVAGGYAGGQEVASSTWSAYEAMLAINLRTAHAAVRAVLPGMLARGAGSVVSVAGTAGLVGRAGESAYAGAKAALLRLVESVAAEGKAHGVRANAVLPGTMDTPANRSWMSPEAVALAVPTEAVAEAILFLASDAARAVTGAALPVTGKQ